jgi:hypothetical protein
MAFQSKRFFDFIKQQHLTARKKSDREVIYEEVLFIFEATVHFFYQD